MQDLLAKVTMLRTELLRRLDEVQADKDTLEAECLRISHELTHAKQAITELIAKLQVHEDKNAGHS